MTNKPGSAEDQTVLDVEVKEKATGTFSVGLGYSSVDKLIAQGSVSQDNFLGRGLKLKVSGSLGGSSTTYSLGITDPYFLDTNWTLGFEVYKSEREYDDYDDNRIGGAIRAGHPITRNSKLYLTYRYEEKEVIITDSTVTSPIILDSEGESSLSSVTAEWIRKNTDDYQDPSRGGITKVSLEYAGLGGTDNFFKSVASHRHFFPLFWGTVFTIHGEVGYVVKTSDESVPLGEKFFLGGINSYADLKPVKLARPILPIIPNISVVKKWVTLTLNTYFPLPRNWDLRAFYFTTQVMHGGRAKATSQICVILLEQVSVG